MNQKEKLNKKNGADKINERYFKSWIGCMMYFTTTCPDILNVVIILSCICIVQENYVSKLSR